MSIANTHPPPYYAVIFSSLRAEGDNEAYRQMAQRMVELAKQQPGYLGYESVRDGLGITISYWKDLTSIKAWKQVTDHLEAQRLGREKCYKQFKTRICLVERDYGMSH